MQRIIRIAVVALTGISLATLGTAGPASAANASGSQTCGSTWSGRLTSDTNGNTTHTWTNRLTGDAKLTVFKFGGVKASLGYQQSYWVLTASSINGYSTTCVQ